MAVALLTSLLWAQPEPAVPDDPKGGVGARDTEVSTFFVFFSTASHEITAGYETDLDRIATQAKAQNQRVQLKGFTDNIGSSRANEALAARRAEAIAAYLTAAGVPEDFIRTNSFGEDQPLADNATEEGRSQNRRVEITLLSEAALAAGNIGVGDTTLFAREKADSLQQTLILPNQSKMITKKMPVVQRSKVLLQAVEKHLISSNGSTVLLQYDYNSGDAPPHRIFLQVEGATSFYDIPIQQQANSGQMEIPISFPTQLGKGEIAVIASLFNKKGQLSQQDTTFVSLERVGSGKLQISLSWDNETDQDLHVTTPAGVVINFRNFFADSGGELDRDDLDGFGPENVFWNEAAPDGLYKIRVHDYESSPEENAFVVTINGLGVNKQFYGSTQAGSKPLVVEFEKKGEVIIWK